MSMTLQETIDHLKSGQVFNHTVCKEVVRHLEEVKGVGYQQFMRLREENDRLRRQHSLVIARAAELTGFISDHITFVDTAEDLDKLMEETAKLNCPMCGGSGHIGDTEYGG